MTSAAKLAANQHNAQLSTGPTSEAGKGKSSLNAVKTGLTGQTVLLPGDDAAAYQAHIAQYNQHLLPVGEQEQHLVQSLADTSWRLLRIPALEMGIYALGRLEFAGLFPNEDPAVREQLIQAHVFIAYQRQLNNLSIQENRLLRRREKDNAALRELQDKRKRETKARLDKAAGAYAVAVQQHHKDKFDPAEFGFEFSVAQIEFHAVEIYPDLFAECEWEPVKNLRKAA